MTRSQNFYQHGWIKAVSFCCSISLPFGQKQHWIWIMMVAQTFDHSCDWCRCQKRVRWDALLLLKKQRLTALCYIHLKRKWRAKEVPGSAEKKRVACLSETSILCLMSILKGKQPKTLVWWICLDWWFNMHNSTLFTEKSNCPWINLCYF